MEKHRIKYNLKDSVFTSLFSIPEYLRELYLSLPGSEENIQADEIKIENIRNTIVYGIYNDIGFTVGGRKLILVEAQSTLSPFIPQRMNNYFCSLLYQAFPRLEVEQYRSKMPEDIPEVLLAVVYTGKEKVPEYYETEFSFNSGQTMKIRVSVLTKHNSTAILKSYCMFSEEYDRNRTLYGRTADAVMKTIEYCNECEDTIPIRAYLREKEKEIINIMNDEERQKRLFEEVVRYEREAAEAEGVIRGMAEGEARGEARGETRGESKGMIKTLWGFIKDGLITEDNAAARANMTLEDFRKAAAVYCN